MTKARPRWYDLGWFTGGTLVGVFISLQYSGPVWYVAYRTLMTALTADRSPRERHRTSMRAAVGFTLSAVCFSPDPSLAQEADAEARGQEIALEVDRRRKGFGDYRANLTMVLRDRAGLVRLCARVA